VTGEVLIDVEGTGTETPICDVAPVCPADVANELDWLRTLWDYRTNASPGYVPTQHEILGDLYIGAYPWDQYGTSIWYRMHSYVSAYRGTEQARRFSTISNYNGVNQ